MTDDRYDNHHSYHPNRNSYNRKTKTWDLGFLSSWNTKANAKENVWALGLSFCNCGLLLWIVHAQHFHYENEWKRNSGAIHLPFHCENEYETKRPDFICNHGCEGGNFVIVAVPCRFGRGIRHFLRGGSFQWSDVLYLLAAVVLHRSIQNNLGQTFSEGN